MAYLWAAMKKFSIILLAGILFTTVSAQNIKSEKVTYTYVKLPTNPVKPKPASYYSQIQSGAESINAELKSRYETDLNQAENEYQEAQNNYQANLKAADEQYLKEMEEYNNKSMAKKLVEKQLLNENTIILPESWTRGLVKKSLNLTKRYDQTNPTQIHA
jgi:hypothetical protein